MTAPDPSSDMMLTAALDAALRGWRVHPIVEWTGTACACGKDDCGSPGKHPVLSAWQKKASTDPAQVRKWWKKRPTAGVGIATGSASGLLVVDLDDDPSKPPEEHGTPSWKALLSEHGIGPKTYAVKTARGTHLYYGMPEGAVIGNRARLRPGIDIRGENGFVVAPPSLHSTGVRYTVARDVPVVPAPAWLVAMLVRPEYEERPAPAQPLSTDDRHRRYGLAALDSACNDVRSAPSGARNDTLNRNAFSIGQLVGAGALSEGLAVAGLIDAAQSAGLSDKEAADVVRRAVSDGANKPRALPEQTPPRGAMRVYDGGGPDEQEEPPPPDDKPTVAPPLRLAEFAALSPDPSRAAKGKLRRNPTNQKPIPTALNVRFVLEADPRIGPHVWQDQHLMTVHLGDEEIVEHDITALGMWLDDAYGLSVKAGAVTDAVLTLAMTRRRDPLQEYLLDMGEQWDGVERLDTWLMAGLGVDDTPLNRVYGRRALVGVAARGLEPGCKMDTMLVLCGPQAAKKSSSLRALVGAQWFSDTRLDLASKDALQHFRRPWVHEFAELEGMSKASENRVKAITASQVDDYRPPYARNNAQFPRRCCFFATTNEPVFLSDPTGERRSWPVTTGDCDPIWFEANRDQLWGEAVVAYTKGERWWFTREEDMARDSMVDAYRLTDPWQEQLGSWLADRAPSGVMSDELAFSTDDALNALQLGARDRDRSAARRAGHCLRALGYETKSTRRAGAAVKLWARADR